MSRAQLLKRDVGRGWVVNQVRSGRWRTVHPGVYATHTGDLPFRARVHAALLALGDDAVASHSTAAWLWGLTDDEPTRLTVSVPAERRVDSPEGVRLLRVRGLEQRRHRSRSPAVTTVEETTLDLVQDCDTEDDVVGWLTRACQRRFTTPGRLEGAEVRRSRLRHRALVREVLADVREGAASPLERRYLRDVERAHGLPRGRRGERS